MDLQAMLKAIFERAEKDRRSYSELMKEIRDTQIFMLALGKMTKDQVTTLCSDFIAMYRQLGGD